MIIIMKTIILILLSFILISCGPSKEERQTIAQLTCNIMAESRNMDAAFRIKEINAGREKLGEPAYLGSDEDIKESFEYGLCPDLVLNNDYDYQQLLISKYKQISEDAKTLRFTEEARLAEEARLLAEEARFAEEVRLVKEARLAEAARLDEEVRLAEEESRLLAECMKKALEGVDEKTTKKEEMEYIESALMFCKE